MFIDIITYSTINGVDKTLHQLATKITWFLPSVLIGHYLIEVDNGYLSQGQIAAILILFSMTWVVLVLIDAEMCDADINNEEVILEDSLGDQIEVTDSEKALIIKTKELFDKKGMYAGAEFRLAFVEAIMGGYCMDCGKGGDPNRMCYCTAYD